MYPILSYPIISYISYPSLSYPVCEMVEFPLTVRSGWICQARMGFGYYCCITAQAKLWFNARSPRKLVELMMVCQWTGVGMVGQGKAKV